MPKPTKAMAPGDRTFLAEIAGENVQAPVPTKRRLRKKPGTINYLGIGANA